MSSDVPARHVRPLDVDTWPDFARLVEEHDGVFGGCWCMAFHAREEVAERSPAANRARKARLVRDGRAHAALVYEGDDCVGWCQFGPTDELPRIKRQKAYAGGAGSPPDWRITCFFVHRRHRRAGVAAAALAGALQEIAQRGGGTVESYPEDTAGRTTSAGFLHNASVGLFERYGFTRQRQIGKHHWVVRAEVPATPSP